MGVALFYFDEEMFQLFLGSGKPELIETGAPMLPLIAFAMPGLATINVLAATLRGAGATQTPWKLAIIGFFLIRLPITYTLARPEDGSFWAWGLKGAWVGMLVDLNTRGLMHAVAYFRGDWTKTRV
jgi:Na+-driven multidrug efflux pump